MRELLLTQKSEEDLNQRDNASGVAFIKIGDKNIISFEFHRGKNGELYLTDAKKPTKITTEFEWLFTVIHEEEI